MCIFFTTFAAALNKINAYDANYDHRVTSIYVRQK